MIVDIGPEDLAELKKTLLQKTKAWAIVTSLKKVKFSDPSLREVLVEQVPQVVADISLVSLAPTLMPATQSLSFSALGKVARGGLHGSESPLEEIPETTTFYDWRVVRDLFERILLPIEMERIDRLGYVNLRRYSMTIMHQVICQLAFVFPSPSLMLDFVVAEILHG